jgi:hypothetical protein
MYDFFQKPKKPQGKPVDKTFEGPIKEQAQTGRFMPAGDHYGVGHRQPVGHEGDAKQNVECLPRKSSCRSPEELFNLEK